MNTRYVPLLTNLKNNVAGPVSSGIRQCLQRGDTMDTLSDALDQLVQGLPRRNHTLPEWLTTRTKNNLVLSLAVLSYLLSAPGKPKKANRAAKTLLANVCPEEDLAEILRQGAGNGDTPLGNPEKDITPLINAVEECWVTSSDVLRLVGRMFSGMNTVLAHGHHRMEMPQLVSRGRNLPSALPLEWVRARTPQLRAGFYSDFADGKLLVRESRPPKDRSGGVIVLRDCSGSMQSPMTNVFGLLASPLTFCIALSEKLRQDCNAQGRAFSAVDFTSGVSGIRTWSMQDLHDPTQVKDFQRVRTMCGGTDFNQALNAALNLATLEGAQDTSDLVLITDGEGDITEGTLKRIGSNRSRLFSLMILNTFEGGTTNLRNMGAWCERVGGAVLTDKQMTDPEALAAFEAKVLNAEHETNALVRI